MLELKKEVRDEIVKFLQAQVVPAQVGAGLIQVCGILNSLKEQKDGEAKEDIKV